MGRGISGLTKSVVTSTSGFSFKLDTSLIRPVFFFETEIQSASETWKESRVLLMLKHKHCLYMLVRAPFCQTLKLSSSNLISVLSALSNFCFVRCANVMREYCRKVKDECPACPFIALLSFGSQYSAQWFILQSMGPNFSVVSSPFVVGPRLCKMILSFQSLI